MQLPPSIDLGLLVAPPCLEVPPDMQAGWVLEGSPHPLMIPSAYLVGTGATATFSEEVWQLLGEGSYWIQLSPDTQANAHKDTLRYSFRIASPMGLGH